MAWVPMFAFPNIYIKEPLETPSLALVYAEDQRVKSLAAKQTNFAAYLAQFSTEFGVKISPSPLIWNDGGPQPSETRKHWPDSGMRLHFPWCLIHGRVR
jgi:hypothetical protein